MTDKQEEQEEEGEEEEEGENVESITYGFAVGKKREREKAEEASGINGVATEEIHADKEETREKERGEMGRMKETDKASWWQHPASMKQTP